MTTDAKDHVLQHTIGADGLLVVRLHDGEARIRGTDGDTATVRTIDGDLLDRLEIETGDRSLSIRARRGPDFLGLFPRDPRSTELEVDVPAGATVVIEAASADIAARGLRGDQRYRSASGDLRLDDVSGRVAGDTVSGDLVIVATGSAAVTARTVSGDLSLRAGTVSELHATTTSGDMFVAARFEGAGPFAIETVSGDLVLAPADDVRIEASTITGDLRSDIDVRRVDDGGRRALVMGRGGPTIGFRSTSGDLRLARSAPFDAEGVTVPAPPAAPTPPMPPIPPTASSDAHPTIVDRSATTSPEDPIEAARLAILRDLERGAIDVAEAGRRLETLETAAEPVEGEGHRA